MVLETYTLVFVDADALDRTSAFYRWLLAGEETLRFAYPEVHLQLAAVSSPQLSVLIIAGSAEARRPFEATRLTIKADVLEPVLEILAAAGAQQLEPVQPTPVGRKTRFKHVEGVELNRIVERMLDLGPTTLAGIAAAAATLRKDALSDCWDEPIADRDWKDEIVTRFIDMLIETGQTPPPPLRLAVAAATPSPVRGTPGASLAPTLCNRNHLSTASFPPPC